MNSRNNITTRAAKRSSGKWLIRLSVVGVVVGLSYVVWLMARPAVPPTPPEVDIKAFEPLVAAAITTARSEVLEKPYSPDLWGVLGCVFNAHTQYEAADICYAQATLLDPDNFAWAYLRARLAAYQNLPDAVALLRNAIRLHPEYLAVRIWLADTLVRENKIEEAQREYLSALQLDTQNPRVLLGLGRTYHLLGNIQEAQKYLSRCASIKPMWKDLQSLLSRVLREQGDVDGARRAAALAAKLPKDALAMVDPVASRMEQYAVSAIAFAGRGGQAFAAGDLVRAEQELSQALRLRPNVAFRHYDMGRLRDRQGRNDEAIDYYEKAISLDPGLAAAHYNLGLILRRLGDPAGAMASFAETVKLDAHNADAHHQLGLIYSSRKEPEKALAAMQRAVELQPEQITYAQSLALHLQNLKREAEAVEALSYVLSIEKGNSVLISQLAWMLATSSDDEVRNGQQALDLLQPVASRKGSEEDLQLQATLAAALAEVGRYQEALAVLDILQVTASGTYEPFEQRLQQMRDLFEKDEPFHR